jgi:hypothetical protein
LLRFITYALPALLLLLALFGFAVELLDVEPHQGSVVRLALFDTPLVPAPVVLGAWLMEASGLLALFLLARGRCGAWWLDGLVTGWLAWVFRGPLLVITIVVATRQPQHPWWTLAFGWWVLYSICGLFLAHLARRSELGESDDNDEPEPALIKQSPNLEKEPELTDRESYQQQTVEEKTPLEKPESTLETYSSSKKESAREPGAVRVASTQAESPLTVDKEMTDQPESGESGPEPVAEEI